MAYSQAVHQSRHPAVCAWVRDAVDAAEASIRQGAVARIALSIHRPADGDVVERWVFDLDRGFPLAFDSSLLDHQHQRRHYDDDDDDDASVAAAAATTIPAPPLNTSDLHQSWRAALQRLAIVASSLPPTPENCTFAIALELRTDAAPPTTQHHPPALDPL
ncbi:hypothetical protein L249_2892 [Ophiocordyceps polyrhachis-furcata BCC 54312]|uniref:HORMA domain-containing protein n=1 Tax=Ophiocordyceps polyrhachis-furcata BCC 54312 TaxID=1330021 RepID=A0A367LSH5_9HYPO|nr:hypothetical protein L249_2892 [Ophiocordyceps polyrhachis-furcata BCC 54312]